MEYRLARDRRVINYSTSDKGGDLKFEPNTLIIMHEIDTATSGVSVYGWKLGSPKRKFVPEVCSLEGV